MTQVDLARLHSLLTSLRPEERHTLFKILREEFPIHELERKLNVTAEVILEAISRASDLTLRGIRGIIAEAAFKQYEISQITETGTWKDNPLNGDHSFDFAIEDAAGIVKVQVKMQRQKEQRPMLACEANKTMFGTNTDQFVVETQRTRGGTDKDGKATRPYKFGEFDILAVAMHPSTGDWSKFLYTVERWLIPTPNGADEVFEYQPVPRAPNDFWTNSLTEVIEWLRSDEVKTLPRQP
jgi:hypothetical protein